MVDAIGDPDSTNGTKYLSAYINEDLAHGKSSKDAEDNGHHWIAFTVKVSRSLYLSGSNTNNALH